MSLMTGCDHEHSDVIEQAVEWYAANYGACERPIVPTLQRRFGLTAHQAIVVIRETTLRRARAA
ncbi:hypothetical protein EN962_13975 [Mesorhizobium sp. M7A.F.Ca.CA.001.09.2.1]|uniref:Transposase n=1 Tax=Mesorhizobium ciceri TaxID=39645 RepID=A0AB38T614_9HYPH|nr:MULTISPECIES: hypothetical protein [Mesorhizobium]RUY55476.1 hypothetical protein EN981_06710 [Mesorhizobium sp. M7A.F.Ca.CA.001.13.2.1]MDF3216274.1 hypothetical protein [Mesorhizobium ciceri]RUY62997.1 hypothetical protein EN965_23985 [Mesorhizobium sp. M7A.F.Ca.CA.001.05.1.1]RUY65224.1 hypothetical protein EN980_23290 [Mesorhizobium sp. M7A.F.Ca.CA.001.13.1.1]RUY78067.1 hypothetical protein EN962_13975 [Mesorhizobium sp. M7A.F.Ca.CA.001.09.2.1]